MRVINVYSVNHALNQGCFHLHGFGIESESRNGPVIVSPMPVMTIYNKPRNRVLINEDRDANPFFHLFESLWMLAGRNDVAFPATFVDSMKQYSDDGETLHGAYGHRWRHHFGYDQLEMVVSELKKDPNTRRAVLSMWDGNHRSSSSDLHVAAVGGKDVPCNTHAYFDTIDGKLNMTVCCRSNDMIFGAYGANAVHFSILLEYVAAATGLPLGVYRQFSNNFHAYTELYTRLFAGTMPKAALSELGKSVARSCPYAIHSSVALDYRVPVLTPMSLMSSGESASEFLEDCEEFCRIVLSGSVTAFKSSFFRHVVVPMFAVWQTWKNKEYSEAKHLTLQIRADDWRLAAQSWLSIREARRNEEK